MLAQIYIKKIFIIFMWIYIDKAINACYNINDKAYAGKPYGKTIKTKAGKVNKINLYIIFRYFL